MRKESDEDKLKQTVSQYLFDIKKQVSKKAYWNATKLSHELFELLDKQPYIESDNPPESNQAKTGGES